MTINFYQLNLIKILKVIPPGSLYPLYVIDIQGVFLFTYTKTHTTPFKPP